MKHKVGDVVKVRDDLKSKVEYGGIEFLNSYMNKYLGKEVTIEILHKDYYEIEEDGNLCCWTDEMFEDNECEWFDTKGELELNGIVSDADYEYQKIVKINPIALHYEDEVIKYVCPICQSLGVRLQLEKAKSNCTNCNVNLNWEE